ncbi:MAG: SAM-dependent chlorinase/fluorinase [bacterium]
MIPPPGQTGVVALVTDFGMQDDYVGQMHAAILSVNPELRIIDLCHFVPAGNVRPGAFLLYHDLGILPEGSAVGAVVDPGVGSRRALLAAEIENRYLVAPDNGLIAPLLDRDHHARVYRLENREWVRSQPSSTFHGRDIIGPAAAMLASGHNVEDAGPPVQHWASIAIHPVEQEDGFAGEVMWVDRFGNLITNLTADQAEGLTLWIDGRPIRRVSTFVDADSEEIVYLIGSRNTVEIVRNGDSAAEALGLGLGAVVRLVREPV